MNKKKILSTLVTCAMLAMPFTISASAAIPHDKMIAMYNMEGELKNSVSNASGKLWNGASLVDDAERGGKVLYLNNDDVVSPGQGLGYEAEGQWAELAAPYIPDSDQMTVSLWLKLKEARNWARAIDLGDANAQNNMTGGPDRFMNISPVANTSGGDWFVGTFNCNDMADMGVPNNRDRAFADPAETDKWIHAALVINKNGTASNVLYVNGVAYESKHGEAVDPADPAEFSPKDILAANAGLRNVFLGRSAYEGNGDQIMNGWIDDVAIFSVALTADQIKELSTHNFAAAAAEPEAAPAPEAEAAAPEAAAQPETPAAPATPAPAQTSTAPAPRTADPITLIALGSIISAAGVVIAKKRK